MILMMIMMLIRMRMIDLTFPPPTSLPEAKLRDTFCSSVHDARGVSKYRLAQRDKAAGGTTWGH